MRAAAAALGLTLALPSALAAHDYWLELSKYCPAAGEAVLVSHRVGENLAGEAVPRNPLAIVRFDLVAADGSATPVPGRDGFDPAGFLKVDKAGPARIVFQSTRSFVELLPEKFSSYLELEGLQKIERERQRLGKGMDVAREAFSRSAAAQLCVGASSANPGAAGSPPAPAGLDLEIVPDRALCAAKAGSEIGFRVLFRGQPVEGLLVMALSRANPAALTARTDRRGHVGFKLDRPGFWLIKAVEMRPLAAEPRADWESFWASLTFELAAAAP
jgi:uncharacterized GH25 family protein